MLVTQLLPFLVFLFATSEALFLHQLFPLGSRSACVGTCRSCVGCWLDGGSIDHDAYCAGLFLVCCAAPEPTAVPIVVVEAGAATVMGLAEARNLGDRASIEAFDATQLPDVQVSDVLA
jgi:hypothetical protein